MDGTFIISDYKAFIKSITEELKIEESHIISLPTLDNDSSYHDWTKQIFADQQINKLIIPISLPTDNPINTVGIRIALHIRLNYELKLSQRLIPIILLSDLSYHKFLDLNYSENDNNPQNLLFTKGIYLSSFDIDEIQKVLGKAESCPPENYYLSVLNKLKILRKANTGKHSIANAWGCFKLAAVTGSRDQIFKDEAISHHLKTLYAKYLICYNNAWTDEMYVDLNPIKCRGKKILFIDDQSDEGWFKLIKKIFNEAGENLISVDSSKYKNKETKLFHDYKGFYTECLGHIGAEWDLVIIDLRLNPEKEDIENENIAPTEFSGYKLIDEFLNENEGYQIIVSTASNKIWNINAALQRGANTYYIKESPDFNYSLNETKKHYENFKLEAQKCFERSYLRDVYTKTKYLKANKLLINANDTRRVKDYKFDTKANLEIAFALLKTVNTIEFALFDYLKMLEDYCNLFTYFDEAKSKAIVYKTLEDSCDRKNEQVVFELSGIDLKSKFKYIKDHYPFLKRKDVKDKQFVNYIKEETCYKKEDLKFSFALKLAAVLDLHIGDLSSLPHLMELIFIRNQKIAHNGRNFDNTKRLIDNKDIITVFSVINILIGKTFK